LDAALDGDLDAWSIVYVILFALCSLLLLALAYCMLFICRALMLTVDSFCTVTIGGSALKGAVPRWNVVQAVLRKASEGIQAGLFIMSTAVLSTLLLGAADFLQSEQRYHGHASLVYPGLLVIVGLLRAFFLAGLVTDKCARVPSLINSCYYGSEIDPDRQYVVTYVMNSAAGFHVFDLRLTSSIIVKFAYVCAVGVFTLSTRFLSFN